MSPPPLDAAIARVVDTDHAARVVGIAISAPESSADGSRLRVAIGRVDGSATRGIAAVAVGAGSPDVLPGDVVAFSTRLRSVRGLCNPGVADAALAARATGIDVFAGVGPAAAIARLDAAGADRGGTRGDDGAGEGEPGVEPVAPAGTMLLRAAARARRALARAIDGVVDGPARALIHTAVLGERRGNSTEVEDGFRAAGVTHVLSVSGLHLAAIGLVFFSGARGLLARVPRLPLWIDPRAAAALVALPAIAFYTALTGAAVATVRSAAMMACALAAFVVGRRNTPVVAIAAAITLLLAWSPLVLFDVSFQLSVVSVLALATLVPLLAPGARAAKLHTHRSRWLRAGAWAARFGAATAAAGLTTAPLVAHHFGEITPAAPLGNAILVPLVEMVVVPFGLAGAGLGAAIGRAVGWPFLMVAAWGSRLALAIAGAFRSGAPIWLVRSPSPVETAALTIGIACGLAAVRGSAGGRRRMLAVVAVIAVGGGGGSIGARELARRFDTRMLVTFLDVGQGDAAVVQIPGGHTILIDGGGTYDGSFDPGARVVEPFLRARGITALDAVALSHPHPDHLGGLHRIVDRFPIGALWTSGDDGHNPDYHRLIAEAHAHGTPTPIPERRQIGPVSVEPLGPFVSDVEVASAAGVAAAMGVANAMGSAALWHHEHIGAPEGTTVNDASLVLRLAYAGRAVLFTGDLEADGEGELVGRATVGGVVASDVIKVPHHGSRTSSSDELLDVVRPRVAVMSLGWMNRFHFPRAEVVERYRARGIALLRTDRHGAITIAIGADGSLSTTCARGCR